MSTDVATYSMTESEATKLTEKIRITAHNYAEARQRLTELVEEAKAGNAHLALGYASWTAYLAEVLGEEPMRLARGERQEMVSLLSGEGMSTRAIAPIVGASREQVRRDMAPDTNVSPEPPAPVQGMDGKTYSRPEPKVETYFDAETGEVTTGDIEAPRVETLNHKPPMERRSSILDSARNAGWELRKAVERIQRIQQDDRFNKNKAEILDSLRPHLDFAEEVLQDL